MVIGLDTEYLRRHVLDSAANCAGSFAHFEPLGEAKVNELNVAAVIEQNILHLNISIDDAMPMQVVKHEAHLDGIQHRQPLGKVMHLEPQRQQLAILHIVGDYVKEPLGLPVVPRFYNERVVHAAGGDRDLVLDLLQRAVPYHLTLPHDLHRVDLFVAVRDLASRLIGCGALARLPLDFDDVTERATTYDVKYFKVGLGHLAFDAKLRHEQRLVDVHGIVGVGVPVRVEQWLRFVFASWRVPERVALDARGQESGRGFGALIVHASLVEHVVFVVLRVVLAQAHAREQVPLRLERL